LPSRHVAASPKLSAVTEELFDKVIDVNLKGRIGSRR